MSSSTDEFQAEVQHRRDQLTLTQKILSLARTASSYNDSFREQPEVHRVDDRNVLRPLKGSEVNTLQKDCRCTCKNWSGISLLVSPPELGGIDHSERLRKLVSNTTFEGFVVLGINADETLEAEPVNKSNNDTDKWKRGPMGIHNNFLIANSIVSTQSWVHSNTLVSDTHVFPHAVLMACGSVTASSSAGPLFLANDGAISISVGAESGGGRPLALHPESTMIQLCQQLSQAQNNSRVGLVSAGAEVPNVNVISSHCVVRSTPTVEGIYLAPNSSVHAATAISDVILLPTATISNTCIVENARLQWNSSIVDNSRVSHTLLMEEAHVGPNSFVASTVLGPDVHVSAGEVHCSVLGPNTNAHHQSLVISILWPLGRGNVGYGANIGSNHTGRIPDQETSSGEGVFWGLSCVIKFPVDLTMAPYSIVAAGTTLPPQRVCMPFSLIVGSNDGNNTIMPGWVLSSSPYTISRSEKKYATRRKAKRHEGYTGWKIIRPDTVDMCRWARNELKRVGPEMGGAPASSVVYTSDKAVKGIGSNVLSEKGRISGIKAYTECIQRFALEGLLAWLIRQNELGMLDESYLENEFNLTQQTKLMKVDVASIYDSVAWPSFPWDSSEEPTQLWAYQKNLLKEEFLSNDGDVIEWLVRLLETLVVLQKNYANKIYQCKQRDDKRGAKTVPGYEASHTPAAADRVIVDAQEIADKTESCATKLIAQLKRGQRSRL